MGDALIGTIVEDRYCIEARLGAGAMGCVYKARHIRVGHEVAIKVMRADLVSEPQVVARFEREAQVAARLHHPNLVGVLDVGATPAGDQLMVMELAPGVSLAELVEAPLPRERTIALLTQLLRGLAFAHDAGLVHRDLKPENVLVDVETWHARIVDFGIAVLRDRDGGHGRRLTDAGLVVGTPMYMAPEQASAKAIDHRADLFALGVIAYELLAGTTPFEGTGAEVALANVTLDPPYIADRVPGLAVDPLLEAFARTLMARRPEARFASAHEALAVLDVIDRDREAAAKLLGLRREPMLEAPPAVLRLPRGSDALSTLPMAPPEHAADTADRACVTEAMAAPEFTERIVRAPHRRGPIAAAVIAVLALVIGGAIHHTAARARVTMPTTTTLPPMPAATTMIELPEPPHAASTVAAVVTAPHPLATDATRAHHHVVAPRIPAHAGVRPSARDTSAGALAARYRAIGNALLAHGTDELWQRYRLIHLGAAMATADSREQALAVLDAIEHALPVRS